MQNLRIRDPGPVRGGGRQAISAEWANRMRDCVMALARVIPQQTRKPHEWNQIEQCSFGEIVLNNDPTNNRAILGGAITCGDQNFNVANYPFPVNADGSADGQWLIEISISDITFNTDDDDSLILPGIETTTGTPTWNKIAYTGSENYTSNTNPTTPTGTGTVVLPIGLLTVREDKANFANTGCGSFIIDQCAGVFSYSRVDDALEARIQAIEDYLMV